MRKRYIVYDYEADWYIGCIDYSFTFAHLFKLKDMTSAFQTSRSEKQSIETQFATIFKELEAYKKDNATLKERSEKATALKSKYKQNYTELQFVYFLRVTFIL